MLSAIWAYRNFIITSIRAEFRGRFIRSRLGGLWMIIHPLAQVAIYAFVLSSVLAAKLPGIDNRYAYAIYLMSGMLGWSFFNEIISRSLNVFIDNGNILKKIVFPKITLPLIVVGSSFINYLLLFGAIIVIFTLLGHYPSWQVVWLIPLTVLVIALGTGIGLIVGSLNVFIRDIGQVIPVLLQFMFWFTPIVYMPSIIPPEFIPLLSYNPMYPVIMAYQEILLYGRMPDFTSLIGVAITSLILLIVAKILFKRANAEMVDML